MEITTDLHNNSFKGMVVMKKCNCKGLMREKVKTVSANSSLKQFCHNGEQRNRVETIGGWRVVRVKEGLIF